jgi:hypothetical protein
MNVCEAALDSQMSACLSVCLSVNQGVALQQMTLEQCGETTLPLSVVLPP